MSYVKEIIITILVAVLLFFVFWGFFNQGKLRELTKLNNDLKKTNQRLESRIVASQEELNVIETRFRDYRDRVEWTYSNLTGSIDSSIRGIETIEDTVNAIQEIVTAIQEGHDNIKY